jgi:hypothetical protein
MLGYTKLILLVLLLLRIITEPHLAETKNKPTYQT